MGILHIGNEQRVLTLDLARSDPETYANQVLALYADFDSGPVKGGRVIAKLLADRDLKGLKFDPSTWVGETRDDIVTLGVAPLDPDLRKRIIFEDERFIGDREVLYRLSHELSHLFAPAIERILPSQLVGVYGAVVESRRQTDRGLSALGSLDFYRVEGPLLQAHEDTVELVNMYLIDSAYLKRFLSFLCQTDDRVLAGMGLMKIESGVADFIFYTIERGVGAWLREKRT